MASGFRSHTSSSTIFRRSHALFLVVAMVFLLAGIAGWALHRRRPAPAATAATDTGSTAASKPEPMHKEANFLPTIPNAVPAPGGVDGMAWIPGGEFSMGAQDAPDMNDVAMHATTDSRPIHRVYVDGFWMDRTDVTNEEFAKFAEATASGCKASASFRRDRSPAALTSTASWNQY